MAAGREQSTCIAIFFCLALVYFGITVINKRKRTLLLPPGPTRLPLLGNIHQVPFQYQYYTFTQWAREYGEIVYTRFFQQDVVIVNTLRVAQELMEKRGIIYSDRPRFVVLAEVRLFHPNYGLMPYGDEWRRQRKWAQTTFQARGTLETYRPLQQREVRSMLSSLIQAPENFAKHINRYVAGTSMEAALDLGRVGSSLADFFPIFQHIPCWMPGAGFKREALRLRRAVEEVTNMPFEHVKTAMSSGTAKTSFVRRILEETSELATNAEDERRIKASAAMMHAAGMNTMPAVMISFILAMVVHPDVYRKAQVEMDAVVGRSRLPNLDDRLALPYLECVLKEVYRWCCPVPLGAPHAILIDDQYHNYLIPGKSTVIPNIWAMSRDPEIYTEADVFDPDRFSHSLPDTDDLTDPRKYIFGLGRRYESFVGLMYLHFLTAR
ncbi:cytochrome P450 [Laetiporus sulphureus 93-53]|uniref:Cytochrome P450 n=1 Tax=Laetiporus sulphureus 93-53 TaxID=1314785 RepID=A0A165IDP9_9APHY|nr:cytochrome P450 [Laetiporus sulphureus 93-53]KZT12937.1 cytochrome P450 [Laetiporus sulphureus 93-53]